MSTYILCNNTDGTYRNPSLYIPNNSHKIVIESIFVDKSFYTANAINPNIVIHSKQLSKLIKIDTNLGSSTAIFSFSGNGITTEHIICRPKLNLWFNNVTNVSKFDDFEFKSIDGAALNLTTNSVRFCILINVY